MSQRINFKQMSASAMGRAIASGSCDSLVLCEDFLDRISTYPDQNIFLAVTAERALSEARASRTRQLTGCLLGPLDGVPISWKDLIDVRGTTTTAASVLRRDDPVATVDAPAVANTASAGMVCLGKVNMTEFAYSGLGLNPHYGTPKNPNDTQTPRIPGGSSSGSGVSVAAGLSPISIGTDTGGSVRLPAAFNGIIGFKTSEHRIPKGGVVPLSDTLDTVGPLTRTVEDAVLVDMALRGVSSTSIRRLPASELHLVIPDNVVFDVAEDAVIENFEACVARLVKFGAHVSRRHLPFIDELINVTRDHGSLAAAEAYMTHHKWVDSPDAERVDPRVVARIIGGRNMSAHDVLTIQQARQRLIAEFIRELDGGLLVMPTTPLTAPEIAPLEFDQELFHKTNLKALGNTMIGNFLATSGLAMPSGCDARGLPTSILFSAPWGEDEHLLSAGLSIEEILTTLQ